MSKWDKTLSMPMMKASYPDEQYEEDSPEARLRNKVFRPYADMRSKLTEANMLLQFAREQVDDKEFASTICKKIVKDLRAAIDRFEDETLKEG